MRRPRPIQILLLLSSFFISCEDSIIEERKCDDHLDCPTDYYCEPEIKVCVRVQENNERFRDIKVDSNSTLDIGVTIDIGLLVDTEPVDDLIIIVDTEPVTDLIAIFDVEPVADITPVVDAEPIADIAPMVDAGPIADMTPMVDTGPIADITPMVDAEPITDIAPMVDAEPITDITPMFDAEPITDMTPTVDAEPVADMVPIVDAESIADMIPIVDAEPIADIIPIVDAEPIADIIPIVDSVPVADVADYGIGDALVLEDSLVQEDWVLSHEFRLDSTPDESNHCDGAWLGQGVRDRYGRLCWYMESDWNSLWIPIPQNVSEVNSIAFEVDLYLPSGSHVAEFGVFRTPRQCNYAVDGFMVLISDTGPAYDNFDDSILINSPYFVLGDRSQVAFNLFDDINFNFNSWQTIRFEVDVNSSTIRVVLNQNLIGEYEIPNAFSGDYIKLNGNVVPVGGTPANIGWSNLRIYTSN